MFYGFNSNNQQKRSCHKINLDKYSFRKMIFQYMATKSIHSSHKAGMLYLNSKPQHVVEVTRLSMRCHSAWILNPVNPFCRYFLAECGVNLNYFL